MFSKLRETDNGLVGLPQSQARENITQKDGNPEIIFFAQVWIVFVLLLLLEYSLFQLGLAETFC